MTRVIVRLPEDAADQLRELARRELRDSREQAAWLILDGLRAAGLDVGPAPERQALAAGKGSPR